MQPRHCFRYNYETDPNEPKHHYWVHKSGLGAFVLFLDESVHRFIFGPNRCSKCTLGIVFGTVMKLTKMNQNITTRSKKWTGCVCFVSGPNRWIVSVLARISAVNATRNGFRHSKETDQNEPKHQYWFQKSGLGAFVSFLARIGAWFVFCPTRCIKCNPGMVFDTITKLTQMNPNITIGSKKVDWVRSFYFWTNRCIVSFLPDSVHYATPAWFSTQLRN